MTDLTLIVPEDFERVLGQSLPLLGSEASLTVVAVERLHSPSPRAQPFSVLFTADGANAWAQGQYALVHPQLGELTLFLVPIEPRAGQARLEAIFN